jgi:hypothetical protein
VDDNSMPVASVALGPTVVGVPGALDPRSADWVSVCSAGADQ